MGKAYGIEICRQALKYLSTDKNIHSRLSKAISEMKVMRADEGDGSDLSKTQLRALNDLSTRFNKLNDKNDDINAMVEAADALVSLCVEIIVDNTNRTK